MKAASQVPSGVLISTSVSNISEPISADAVEDEDTDAAMPAPTTRAVKSRRVISLDWNSFAGFFSSSVLVMAFRAKILSHFGSPREFPHHRLCGRSQHSATPCTTIKGLVETFSVSKRGVAIDRKSVV